MNRRLLLAVLAGLGVLAASCTTAQSHELSDLGDDQVWAGEDVQGTVYETGLIIFDMPTGDSGWIFVNSLLPFPKATDGTDACELPTGEKYYTDSPPSVPNPILPGAHVLRITRTDDGFTVRFDNDKTAYSARMDDYTSTTEYRFWRGMPISFRPCPPWAK